LRPSELIKDTSAVFFTGLDVSNEDRAGLHKPSHCPKEDPER
jgi:hypothetical protein